MNRALRLGLALVVGAVLVGIAGLVALVLGNDARFFQACAVIAGVCMFAAAVMSGVLFTGGSYPSRAAMSGAAQAQRSGARQDEQSDDPVNEETRSRLNSLYPLLAGLPSLAVALVHYL